MAYYYVPSLSPLIILIINNPLSTPRFHILCKIYPRQITPVTPLDRTPCTTHIASTKDTSSGPCISPELIPPGFPR